MEVTEKISVFSGIKSSYPSNGAVLQNGDAEDMINFMIRKARLRKIWGGELYAQIVDGEGPIKWIDRYRNRWICQRSNRVFWESAESSAVFEQIGNIYDSPNTKVRSELAKENIYLVNGIENKVYQRSVLRLEDLSESKPNFRRLGIIPPGNGKIDLRDEIGLEVEPSLILSSSGGGSLSAGTYQYLITWLEIVPGFDVLESLPNGAVVLENGLWGGRKPAQITVGGSSTVTIDLTEYVNAGYDTDRVDGFFVYRREVDVTDPLNPVPLSDWVRTTDGPTEDPDNPFSFGIAFNGPIVPGVTAIDTGAVDGPVLVESNSPPPSGIYYSGGVSDLHTEYGPRFVKEHNDQLFLFGVRYPGVEITADGVTNEFVPATSGIAYASHVGNYDYWGRFTYNIGVGTGQEDTGLAKHRNILYFIKDGSVYFLDGTNPLNYAIRECDPKRGFSIPGSICETPAGIIGLSQEGWGIIDSPGPIKIISEEIFDKIGKINFTHKDKIHSSYDPKEGKYECHLPHGSNTNVSRVFSYDVNLKTWEVYSKRIGGAVKYALDSKKRKVGLLGNRSNGELYDITDELVVTIDGEQIKGMWRSKNFDFGHPDKLKRLKFIRIKARAVDDFSLGVEIVLDSGQQQTVDLGSLESESVYATWAEDESDSDGGEYGESDWSGETVPVKFEILAEGVARNFQIILRESGEEAANANFEIEEIILVAELMGR